MVRYLLLISGLTALYAPSNGQPSLQKSADPVYHDIRKQRLLIHASSNYLFTASQGQIEKDSAVLFACRIYGLSPLLPYSEGFTDGSPSAGSILIDSGKIRESKELLTRLTETEQIRLLLELGIHYLFKPGNSKTDLDSAEIFIRRAVLLSDQIKNVKWQNESRSLLGKYYDQVGNQAESQKYFSDVVDVYKRSGDQQGLALALENQAVPLPYNDPKKISSLNQSLAIYRSLQDREKEIEILTLIVGVHFMTNWATAEKELAQVLELQKAIGFRHLMFVHDVMSYLADLKADFINASVLGDQTIEDMRITGDYSLAPLFYMRLGAIYVHLFRNDQAIFWYQKSLSVKTKETQLFWYKSFISQVHLLESLNRSGEALALIKEVTTAFPPQTNFDKMNISLLKGYCYEHLKQYRQADENYEEFDSLARLFPKEFAHTDMIYAYIRLSSYYFHRGQYRKSRNYVARAQTANNGQLSVANQNDIYLTLFNLDSAEGKYIEAIRDHQRYKFYNDSMLSISQRTQMAELLLKYETEKKDQNIVLLKQEGKIQQADLKQSRMLRDISFAGVGLLLVIMGLLYKQFRNNKKNNQINILQNQVITHKNQLLQHLLTEKEWLLKEVHHRVKNNLHTVICLLESQAAYLQNDALKAIENTQHRIYAMSLIHQKLYQSEDVKTIDMEVYIPEFIQYLSDGFDLAGKILFTIQVEPLKLSITQAIPIALIINEAVTNSIKYAFPDHKKGEILVYMERNEGQIQLVISDNGIGINPLIKNTDLDSLGLELMKGLSQDIHARITFESEEGTIITVRFEQDLSLTEDRLVNTPVEKEVLL